jgi:purine-binding chemotaxis protein CheW
VFGIRSLALDSFEQLPPLLSGALPDCVQELGALDGHTMAVLETGRLLPETVWNELGA